MSDDLAEKIRQLIDEETNGHHEYKPDDPYLTRLRDAALTTEQLEQLKQPPWLIDGILQANSLAEIYGKPGAYKSFIAAAWALHITTGLAWNGNVIRAGPVIYVASEGAHGMGQRTAAWRERYDERLPPPPEWHPLRWLPIALALGNPAWGDALGRYALEERAALIVIDTRARNTVGLEENSAKDMGLVVAHLDHARSICQSCILLVHHANAFGDKSRGSTAVEGAVDTQLCVKEADGLVTVKLEKQKNGPDGQSWQLKPTPSAASIVLEPVGMVTDGGAVTDAGWTMLETLRAIDIGDPISHSQWFDSGTVPKATFNRQRKALIEHGLVVKEGVRYRPGKEGGTSETKEPF